MALAGVATVEAERVDAVQALHSRGERFPSCLEDEVIVRPEQAVRVCSPADASRRRLEQVQEVEAVEIDDEDRRPTSAAGRDVEVTVLELASRKPGHRHRR